MQALALAYADRCAALVDANERLFDARAGGKGYKDDRRDWDHEQWGNKEEPLGRERARRRRLRRPGPGRGRGKGRGRGRRGSNSNYVQRKYGNKKYGDQDRRAASARRHLVGSGGVSSRKAGFTSPELCADKVVSTEFQRAGATNAERDWRRQLPLRVPRPSPLSTSAGRRGRRFVQRGTRRQRAGAARASERAW